MIVYIRTDASVGIGSGHVMRCLTLADELRERGATPRFVCREHPGNLIGLLEAKGYPVARLEPAGAGYREQPGDLAHASWLGAPWQADAAATAALLGSSRPEWLIVDHYALDARWERQLRPLAGRILAIDDLADRPHDCDFLLDQNLHDNMPERYRKLVPQQCATLLGPRYALLRPEFSQARKNLAPRKGDLERILVFFGGSDPSNETLKALQALSLLNRPDLAVDVVLGGANPHLAEIQAYCAVLPWVSLLQRVENMAQLIARADLAIGAGGGSTWERCCLGLPALVTSIALNQVALSQSAERAGVISYLGAASQVSAEQMAAALARLAADREALAAISRAGMEIADAAGRDRVVTAMIGVT
jgi:UDP-2,4-diacetamido-2,4,6-trideoxy-beta-L-altropyranose hydrolase